MWYIYLLACADKSLYCGITTNMEKRLEMHNGLRAGGAKCTRMRRPVSLLHKVQVETKSNALMLENYIQTLPRIKKIPFIKSLEEEQKNLINHSKGNSL